MRPSYFDAFLDPWQRSAANRNAAERAAAERAAAAERIAAERRAAERRAAERRLAPRRDAPLTQDLRYQDPRHQDPRYQDPRYARPQARQPEPRRVEPLSRPFADATYLDALETGEREQVAPPHRHFTPPPATARSVAPPPVAPPAPVAPTAVSVTQPSATQPSAQASATQPGQADAPSEALALRHATEELEAARARVERDRERALVETKAQVIDKMLPVLDNLDRSIEAAQSSPDVALREGIELVRTQFEDALTSMGLERIASVGQRFDPSVHDAIAMLEVDDPAQDNVVVDEWRRGYKLGGRIVRSPQVRVARLRG
jgi:molecular chaperone GrpE